jgi:ankyrin repeat protein
MIVVQNGNLPIVKELIKAGAIIDLQNRKEDNLSAIQIAVHWENDDIVRELFRAGATVDPRNYDGSKILEIIHDAGYAMRPFYRFTEPYLT